METLPKTWANAERVLPLRRCRRRRRRRPPVIWVSRAIAATADLCGRPQRENDFFFAVWAAQVDKKHLLLKRKYDFRFLNSMIMD